MPGFSCRFQRGLQFLCLGRKVRVCVEILEHGDRVLQAVVVGLLDVILQELAQSGYYR